MTTRGPAMVRHWMGNTSEGCLDLWDRCFLSRKTEGNKTKLVRRRGKGKVGKQWAKIFIAHMTDKKLFSKLVKSRNTGCDSFSQWYITHYWVHFTAVRRNTAVNKTGHVQTPPSLYSSERDRRKPVTTIFREETHMARADPLGLWRQIGEWLTEKVTSEQRPEHKGWKKRGHTLPRTVP